MCSDCFSRPLLSNTVMDADISSTVHHCLSSPDLVTVMVGGSWAKADVKRVTVQHRVYCTFCNDTEFILCMLNLLLAKTVLISKRNSQSVPLKVKEN